MERMPSNFQFNALILLLWITLVAIVGWVRPLYYSTEEMHYASVAWEMWQHHHFVLPIQGGRPYPEKGPLLFWLIHAGWWLFGVSSVWLRLLPALFGLATLYLLRKLVLQLWSDEKWVANIAPFLLLGSFFFAAKIPVARFDVMTTFFVVWALFQLITAIEVSKKHWWLFSISVALGLLTKGPVLFLFVLPAAVTAKWWAHPREAWRATYFYMVGAIALSLLLACCWLAPAILQGGSAYAYQLLFSRSVGRIWYGQQYFQQNWLYYLLILPVMLLPWLIWLPFWRSIRCFFRSIQRNGIDQRVRLLLISLGCTLVFLTFVAEKAPRYILPILPIATILVSYILVKYPQRIQRSDQALIALSYFCIGIGYMFIPLLAPLKLQKYPWLTHISPIWGGCLVVLGLFWLFWRRVSLKTAVTGLAVSTVLFWTCYHLGVTKAQAPYGDWRMLGQQVADLQQRGQPVAFVGNADQQLEFFGRLAEPLVSLKNAAEIALWSQQHPQGWVVVRDYHISPMQLRLVLVENVEQK